MYGQEECTVCIVHRESIIIDALAMRSDSPAMHSFGGSTAVLVPRHRNNKIY
jgi:hypothetical protein